MIPLHRWRDRWANTPPFFRFLLAVFLLGLLAAAAVLASKPALPAYRYWRNSRHLEAAREALAQQQPAEARELALGVLRSDSSRKGALPILLLATDALGDVRQSEVAHALLASGDYSAADRRTAWQVVCRSSAMARVLAAWAQLPPEQKEDPAFVSPMVERMQREGMTGEAGRLLSERQPLNPQMELLLMQILLARDTDEAYRQFQVFLLGKLNECPAEARDFVPLIDKIPQENLLPGLFDSYSTWRENEGSGAVEEKLRLARCEMAASKERAEEIFTDTLASFRDLHPLPCARWCLQARRAAEAEDLLKSLPSPPDLEGFELRRAVLEELGDLKAWAALLAEPTAGAFLPTVHADLAYVAARLGDDQARAAAEAEALRTAVESPADDSLIRLARHARLRQLDSLATRAWTEAIRLRTGPLPLAEHVKPVIEALVSDRKESELLELLASYRLIEPANPVIAVQYGYLACLSGHVAPDLLIRDLTPVHEHLPDALPVRCVLALAHLLSNQAGEALVLTEGGNIDWSAANPPYRAIRAIALTAAGRHEQSAVLLADFPWDDLLRSERRILQGLLETVGK